MKSRSRNFGKKFGLKRFRMIYFVLFSRDDRVRCVTLMSRTSREVSIEEENSERSIIRVGSDLPGFSRGTGN